MYIVRCRKKEQARYLGWMTKLSEADVKELEQWIADNILRDDGSRLTTKQLQAHLVNKFSGEEAGYGITNAFRAEYTVALFHHFGYKWLKLDSKSGYYYMRAKEPSTLFHRRLYLYVHWFILKYEGILFRTYSQDEAPMRTRFVGDKFAFVRMDDRLARMDTEAEMGKGEGFGLSAFLSYRFGFLLREDGVHVGYMKATTMKAGRAKKSGGVLTTDTDSKEDYAEFARVSDEFCDRDTAVFVTPFLDSEDPAEIIERDLTKVEVADGARTHLCVGPDALLPWKMNLAAKTVLSPTTLKDILVEEGLWRNGMDLKTARAVFSRSSRYLDQRLGLEVILEGKNGLAPLYLCSR
jgi:hypothetical protein